jgi:hypothetical protein
LAAGDSALILDYEDLTAEAIHQVARRFKLDTEPSDLAALQKDLKTYSKDPTQTVPFRTIEDPNNSKPLVS